MSIHKNYLTLSAKQRMVVDDAFLAVVVVFRDGKQYPAMDDRAERLVEALATYVAESNEE
jgi:hypothetical protein